MDPFPFEIVLLILLIFTTIIATVIVFKAFANSTMIRRIEINVDGRLAELIELTRTSAFAAGKKEEADEELARDQVKKDNMK